MGETTWGERIGIRPLRVTDAAAIRRFMLEEKVADLLFEDKGALPPSLAYVAMMILSDRLSNRPDYGIIMRNGRLIGRISLWRISERNRSAMLSVFIGDTSKWGYGYGTEALRLLLRKAFGPMNMTRIELHVFDFNHRAIRSYEKVGFVQEGVRRQALARGTRYYDILVMGILRDEFLAQEAASKAAATLQDSSAPVVTARIDRVLHPS